MKKIGFIMLLAIAMSFCLAVTAMAEPGLQVGLGYDSLDSTSTISWTSLEAKLNSSCKMYTLTLDYEVNDWLSFSGKYRTGDNNLMTIVGFDIPQDTDIWQVEAALQWGIGEKTKIGAIIGYLDYETTTSVQIAELTSNISGAYIGPVITHTPNDNWEFGASYRYMINADGDMSLSSPISNINQGTASIDDVSYAVAEIYAKTYLSKNWTLRASYTYTSLDWTTSFKIQDEPVKVKRDISGLSVMLGYKF